MVVNLAIVGSGSARYMHAMVCVGPGSGVGTCDISVGILLETLDVAKYSLSICWNNWSNAW